MMAENKHRAADRESSTSEFSIKYLKQLRSGEKPVCPKCRIGLVSTEYNPKTSHFFSCNKCNFMIHID